MHVDAGLVFTSHLANVYQHWQNETDINVLFLLLPLVQHRMSTTSASVTLTVTAKIDIWWLLQQPSFPDMSVLATLDTWQISTAHDSSSRHAQQWHQTAIVVPSVLDSSCWCVQETSAGQRNAPKILVFANRIKTVRFVHQHLVEAGFKAAQLHGDRSQQEREVCTALNWLTCSYHTNN